MCRHFTGIFVVFVKRTVMILREVIYRKVELDKYLFSSEQTLLFSSPWHSHRIRVTQLQSRQLREVSLIYMKVHDTPHGHITLTIGNDTDRTEV